MVNKCYVCKQTKPSQEFYKDKSRKNGLTNNCKDCNTILRRKYRYIPVNSNTEAAIRHRNSEHGKKLRANASRASYLRHKPKWAARAKLRYAVKKGGIIKAEVCEKLNDDCNGKVQGHHYAGYDGDNWKNVLWLCPSHHSQEHMRIKKYTRNL